jgi:Carboxypeptidase regulatory-like domain
MTQFVLRTRTLLAGAFRLPSIALVLGAAMVLSATFAHAQYRASIQGSVTDSTGAVIPGASLTLTDISNNVTVSAKSDDKGNYFFNALPADVFRLVVKAPGFASRTLSGVTIIPEQANTVNLTLALGSATEAITVDAGEVPALDTTTANINGTITNDQIQHMPSFNRDVFQLATLAPGMFGDNSMASGGNENNLPAEQQAGEQAQTGVFREGEQTAQVSGNGGQLNTNNVLIDGIPTASASWGGSTVIVPIEESIQYMKVSANAYDAEFGRFSGAVIQVTSNSGTNSYHGSFFFKADRPGLNAWQRWNGQNSVDPANANKTPANRGLSKDQQRFNQFGGSVGGPIIHDKLWAFFAYETLRNNTVTNATGIYETPAFDDAAPTGSNAAKYLSYPGMAPNAIGVIASSCSSSLGLSNGRYCQTTAAGTFDVGSPLKTPLGNYDTTYTSNSKPGIGSGLDGVGDLEEVATANPSQFTGTQYYGRMDGFVTKKDRLSFIIYWEPTSTVSYNGAARPSNLLYNDSINDAFTALWDHTFSPTLVNEGRASAAGYRYNLISENPQSPFGLPQDTFLNVSPSAEPSAFGPSSPGVFDQWTYTYQDIATKNAGRHTLKAGFQLSHIEFLDENIANARPSFTFESLWDFLNDAPYGESGNFNPQTGVPALNRQDLRENIFGTFVQDDFKVSPTLTINLGLRWNYFGPLYSKENNLSVAVPGVGANYLTGLNMVQGGNLYTVQKGNFGPQIGFAWNPDYYQHKLVLRGGFGMNYEENQLAITISGFSNVPEVLSFAQTGYSSKNPAIQYTVAPDIHSPLGFPSNPAAVTTFNAQYLPKTAVVSIDAFDNHVKTIAVYHYSLDMEMQLASRFVATIGYQGSSGHHLLYEQDLNAVAVVHRYSLNPQLNRITDFTNGANSNYNALLATLKHNFARSFQVEADYTWSKSMDEGSTPYNEDAYAPISIHDVYGRSDYNFTNNFRVFGLYQPNFFHERWLHMFADGWSLGGIYEHHSDNHRRGRRAGCAPLLPKQPIQQHPSTHVPRHEHQSQHGGLQVWAVGKLPQQSQR